MKTNDKVKIPKTPLWALPFILIIIVIVLDFLFNRDLYQFSLPYIDKANEYLRFNIMGYSRNDPSKIPEGISYTAIKVVIYISKLMTSNICHFFMAYLFYNFMNIYKTFILLCSIYVSTFLSTFLSLILLSPRPYMTRGTIVPIWIKTDWGNPNNSITTTISFYCTLFFVIFKNKKNQASHHGTQWLVWFLFFSLNCLFLLIEIVNGQVALNQLIVSVTLGYSSYLLILYVLKPKVNNSKDLYQLISNRFMYIVVTNIILFAFMFILYYCIQKDELSVLYKDRILAKKELYLSDIFNYQSLLFDGVFINAMSCFTNAFPILGIKIEMKISYKGNIDLWSNNNFESKEICSVNYSSLTRDTKSHYGTQWNHTSSLISLIRFIIWIVISCVALISFFINLSTFLTYTQELTDLTYNYDQGILNGFLREILPEIILTFGMFYLFKGVVKKLKLVNKTDEFGLNTK